MEENIEKSNEVYIYFSFDIVNSSKFKYHHKNWGELYIDFFKIFDNIAKKEKFNAKLWKYVGDEILFYQKVNKKRDIINSLIKSEIILKEICDCLHSKGKYKNDKKFSDYKDIMQLSVKNTIWMALIDDVNNIKIKLPNSDKIDFLGRDIDIGFRISKYVSRSKTVISANLAYLLLDSFLYKQLRLIDYRLLKGVWMNKRYPIIWFLRKLTINNIPLSFFYDEKYDSDISDMINSVITECRSNKRLQNNMIIKESFEELFKYLGIWEDILKIKEVLKISS